MEWIATIVVGLLAFCGTVISNMVSNSKTTWRIEQLEAEQKKHNSVVERVLILEQSHKSQWKSLEELQNAIKDIKKELYGHE